MKHLWVVLVVILLTAGCVTRGDEGQRSDFSGVWEGALTVGVVTLRVVYHFNFNDGVYSGVMDSPDQGVFGIPFSHITTDGNTIELAVASIAGQFSGSLENGILSGTWEQQGQSFPLELTGIEGKIDYSRPQDPKEPFPYESKDITFNNLVEGINLAGTMTLPAAEHFPMVVLVSGSGPSNRNEEIMNHRPFLVLSDHLTRNGIGLLRFDDRGVGLSEGDHASATSKDFSGDVAAALDYLQENLGDRISRMGIIGHSEGGLIAPMTAVSRDDVDFIVLLAAPAFPGDEILLQQSKKIIETEGAGKIAVRLSQKVNRKTYSIAVSDLSEDEKKEQLTALFMKYDSTAEEAEVQIDTLLSPWFQFFLSYDPRPSLRELTVPVLALNGTLDLQVVAEYNLPAIEDALTIGGVKYRIDELEGLNHLFQTAQTGAIEEYAEIDETMAPQVMDLIADWILHNTTE
jgi:uncharacterized protein